MSDTLMKNADISGLPEKGQVILGFSGGADSTALACYLMKSIEPERITLAHLNHMLRGEEAEADEAAVREFARVTGLRLVVSRRDIAALAEERGIGLEECGRQERYALFASLVKSEDDRIVTAHNADDNVETVLLRLTRGTGLYGLSGIPYQRGNIVRPLLKVSREDIEKYCEENGLSFVTDSTNLTGEYNRNRIRLGITPVLREINPKVTEAVSQTAQLLCEDMDFIETEAKKLLESAKTEFGLKADKLLSAHRALSSAAIRLWLSEVIPKDLERKHLDLIFDCMKNGGAADLPFGVSVRCAQNVLSYRKNTESGEGFSVEVEIPETVVRTTLPNGKVLVLERKIIGNPQTEQKINNLYFKNALDCDIISSAFKKTLTVRTRREGDRFSPAGRNVTKSLKQIFQECGMPADMRSSAVLLELDGTLIWCQGAGAAEGYKAPKTAKTALFVGIEGM